MTVASVSFQVQLLNPATGSITQGFSGLKQAHIPLMQKDGDEFCKEYAFFWHPH